MMGVNHGSTGIPILTKLLSLMIMKYVVIILSIIAGKLQIHVHAKSVLIIINFAATRENRSSMFPTRSDTNRSQKQARSLKFRIQEEWKLYYTCSENKGAHQLHSCCEADLRLCFRIGKNLIFSRRGSISILFLLYNVMFHMFCIEIY